MSGFRSFLFSAQGGAASPMGTFGTSKRKNVGTASAGCGADAIYSTGSSVDPRKHSKGVWRTDRRFVPLVDECSPGPAYMPQENLKGVPGPKFSSAPRFPGCKEPNKKKRRKEPSLGPEAGKANVGETLKPAKLAIDTMDGSISFSKMSDRTSSPLLSDGHSKRHRDLSVSYGSEAFRGGAASSLLRANSKGPKCTFGGRNSVPPPEVTPGYIVRPSLLESLPSYSGRWRSGTTSNEMDDETLKAERQKHEELMRILRSGSHRSMVYDSTTPAFTIGCRRNPVLDRSLTPGPGAYDVAKFNPKSHIEAPTMARAEPKPPLTKGLDSPGPALYSQLRRVQ